MKRIVIALAVFMLLLPITSFSAEEAKDIRKITVSGKAETTLEAQTAEVSLSIKIVSRDMGRSHAVLTDTLARLEKELRAAGLEAKDIRRSLVLQGAEYNWEKESRVLKGYYAQCDVDLTVNDIRKMADVYRILAGYKDISIDGTEFKRNDEFEVRKAEFEKALLAAKKKAEFMAQALGAKVGRVHSIQEAGVEWAPSLGDSNIYEKMNASPVGGGQANYGTITVTARVVVEFELE